MGSEVAGQAQSAQPNQRPQIQLLEQGDLLRQNKRPVRVLRKSKHVSYLAARVPMCLLELSDKDKDTDENVDADRVRTVRPVGSEQCIDLFTQREEIDIDFRVSGLPHAVVKQAENVRVRELVKKIESHPHRQALQADLQQSNACNPFSEKSKKMIRDMGNVELFELCEAIPKVHCSECFLYWTSSPMAIGCSLNPELCHQEGATSWCSACKIEAQKEHFIAHNLRRDISKRVLKKFTIAFRKIQDFVIRNSKLVGLRKSASRWTRARRKISPIVCRKTSTLDIKEMVDLSQ